MFNLDAAKQPRAIDIRLGGADPWPGVYRLDGDTLTLALGVPGGKRPAEFAAPAGSGVSLWVMKRER